MFEKVSKYINKYKLVSVIVIGCVLRLAYIGRIPGEYNYFLDESFSAYEAYSMLNYGIDSHGYHNPIYLESWGSGMSAVQCYIQMLFIKILGFRPVAVRLPQALLACVTLVFVYLLMKEIAEERTAFWATFLFAISPWHLIMSRWGLDCNFFIGFVTIAMYLLISSRNVLWRTILAAVFTGITLYSYASPWIVMPFMVYGTIIYLFLRKEMTIKSILIYTVVLGIVAFPLFLFIAINMGFLPEIRTNIISIPELGYFRSDDVYPSIENVKRMISFFWTQYDFVTHDSIPKYGIYFKFSNIFLIIGFINEIVKRSKRAIIMWIWLACGFVMGCFIVANFERLNILFIPLFFFVASGINCTIGLCKKWKIAATIIMVLLYSINGIMFAKFYFIDYNASIFNILPNGVQEVLIFAQNYEGTIHIQDIRHPRVLCYTQYPVDKYVETVVYEDEHAKFLQPKSFEGYDFTEYIHDDAVKGDVYICSVENDEAVDWLAEHDMSCAQFGKFYLGVAN